MTAHRRPDCSRARDRLGNTVHGHLLPPPVHGGRVELFWLKTKLVRAYVCASVRPCARAHTWPPIERLRLWQFRLHLLELSILYRPLAGG